MPTLLHHLVTETATQYPNNDALVFEEATVTYSSLIQLIDNFSSSLISLGLDKQDRVAIYLPKKIETVVAMFAISLSGGVFVPVNPLLKAHQVKHILNDCNVRILVTSNDRVGRILSGLEKCDDLHTIVSLDQPDENLLSDFPNNLKYVSWSEALLNHNYLGKHRVIDCDMAAIFYTSGSTGKPKGVVLSHRNMVCGAISVAEYLKNNNKDRILALLPFSFDYGFSQLTTTFLKGACAILFDYLLPKDVLNLIDKHKITGLAGVPSLWSQLSNLAWPENNQIRYITNSGGAMPKATLNKLTKQIPNSEIFLMYGLTEAFRSTYLPPDQIHVRPESIGKAIPNAHIDVLKDDGSLCGPNEHGELVHRGSLVSLGYWNDPEKTALRFKPYPRQSDGLVQDEIAVWSGDTVKMDEEGYLYFVGRKDDMIKTSGYRVSPTEIEEEIYASGLVNDACAIGIPDPTIGQAIIIVATPKEEDNIPDQNSIISFCKQNLPNYMIPKKIIWEKSLPKNPNGKFDRKKILDDVNYKLENT